MIFGFRLKPMLDSNLKALRRESLIFVQVPKYYRKAEKIFMEHVT